VGAQCVACGRISTGTVGSAVGRGRLWTVSGERELGGYEIVGRLAVGGMAEVYQARPLPSTTPAAGEGPEVVLKRLLPT